MGEDWYGLYDEAGELAYGEPVSVLTGFNANIDVIYDLDEVDVDFDDVESEELDDIENMEELKAALKYCRERGINYKANKGDFEVAFDGGIERIGGQGGIMAKYLSGLGNDVLFYINQLSEELAEVIDSGVRHPVVDDDGELSFEAVEDAVNSDEVKRNPIFEYTENGSGRFILSDSLDGFNPCFEDDIEGYIEELDAELDRALFSGFQKVNGDEEVMRRAASQLERFDTPIHLEYVHTDDENAELIREYLFDAVDSIGFDEYEAKEIAELVGIDTASTWNGNVPVDEGFRIAKAVEESFDIDRVHLHTRDHHIAVTSPDYDVPPERVRQAMLFGELSAIEKADDGEMPGQEDVQDVDLEDRYISSTEGLEAFGQRYGVPEFSETGIAEIGSVNAIAIPTIIHEDPERLVGMGDVMSSGAFVGEIK